MNWIVEENYAKTMTEVVEPYLAQRKEACYFERIAGQTIYYEHYQSDDPKGTIVISHGFTESIRKFTESVYYMLQAGYNVWGLDHRGHGRSFRENRNPYVVHISRFEDYVLDLQYFTEQVALPQSGELPMYLYCHSMGGCIGAWLIEKCPTLFQKAVLSSPMLGLSFGKIPLPVMVAAASIMGIGEKKKEPLNPVHEFETDTYENSCDSSRCRYEYYYGKRLNDSELQTTSPSIGWGLESVKACARVTSGKNTAKIMIPVLLIQAGEETVVKPAAQNDFASRVEKCRLERIEGMKHELYMTDSETLVPYWELIFNFFD